MTTEETITPTETTALFLRDNIGLYYCDQCLSDEASAGTLRQTQRIIGVLLEYPRLYELAAECDRCGEKKRSVGFLPRL